MPKRIQLVADNDPLFPAQAFFNAISPRDFITTIKRLLINIGAGVDDAVCTFPESLDPGDERFEGIQFSFFEDEVTVDEPTFQKFLIAACRAHIAEHPEDLDEIEKALEIRGWPTTFKTPQVKGHMDISEIKHFGDLLDYFREWRSLDDPDAYDFGGLVHVILACLDNIQEYAVEGEIEAIGIYMTKEQVAFLKRITEAAERSVEDD